LPVNGRKGEPTGSFQGSNSTGPVEKHALNPLALIGYWFRPLSMPFAHLAGRCNRCR